VYGKRQKMGKYKGTMREHFSIPGCSLNALAAVFNSTPQIIVLLMTGMTKGKVI